MIITLFSEIRKLRHREAKQLLKVTQPDNGKSQNPRLSLSANSRSFSPHSIPDSYGIQDVLYVLSPSSPRQSALALQVSNPTLTS